MSETKVEPTSPGASALPKQRLSPVLNPLLASNMGRWAEIYYTTPVEKRDAAVEQLVRDLEAETDASKDGYISARATPAPPPNIQTVSEVSSELSSNVSSPAERNHEPVQHLESPTFAAQPDFSLPEHIVEIAPQQQQVRAAEPVLEQVLEQELIEEEPPAAAISQVTEAKDGEDGTKANLRKEEPSTLGLAEPLQDEILKTELVPEEAEAGETQDATRDEALDEASPQASARIHPPTSESPSEFPHPASVTGAEDKHGWDGRKVAVAAALVLVFAGVLWSWRRGASAPNSTAVTTERAKPETAPTPPPAVNAQASETEASGRIVGTQAKRATPPGSAKSLAVPAGIPGDIARDTAGDKLAAAENTDADLNTGLRYLRGETADHNSAEAAHYLWKAVGKQNGRALVELAGLYAKGDGVVKDCDQAKILLDAASRHKMKNLGTALETLRKSGCE